MGYDNEFFRSLREKGRVKLGHLRSEKHHSSPMDKCRVIEKIQTILIPLVNGELTEFPNKLSNIIDPPSNDFLSLFTRRIEGISHDP